MTLLIEWYVKMTPKFKEGKYRVFLVLRDQQPYALTWYGAPNCVDHEKISNITYTDNGYLCLWKGDWTVAMYPPGMYARVEFVE